MKTFEEVLAGHKSGTFDARDTLRLAVFVPVDQLHRLDLARNQNVEHKHLEWTKENILEQLRKDVAFGFEKALDRRGISAALMFEVVRMWNQILEDGLQDWSDNNYAQYGLPLFKATAIKYGFPDEIEGYDGNEARFSENGTWDD
jgi:hypothetical protein